MRDDTYLGTRGKKTRLSLISNARKNRFKSVDCIGELVGE